MELTRIESNADHNVGSLRGVNQTLNLLQSETFLCFEE